MSAILLLLDGRQLDEAGQAALPGYGDDDHVAADLVARQELLERLARELVGVGIGLAEDLGMLNVVEVRRRDLAIGQLETDSL